jgi:hypothetical protein
MTRTIAVVLLVSALGAGHALAQSDQDHNAHHPEGGQTQAAPMPMQGTADGGMGPMMMMQMMREHMSNERMHGSVGMMRFDHIDGRLAFLRAELGITDAQQPQWNAFADALRAQASKLRNLRAQLAQGEVPKTWPDRLAAEERVLEARLEALMAIQAPVRALYAALSPEQVLKAEDLLQHSIGRM